MKKSSIFWVISILIISILLINFLFHIIYFNKINKNIKPVSELEKQKAIEILNKSLDLSGYEINVKNIYTLRNREIIQADLIKGNSTKHYLVDLKEGRVIKK